MDIRKKEGISIRRLDFTVPPEYDGYKVEWFLKRAHGMSTRVLTRLKHRENGLQRNGVHTRTIDLVHTGDVVSVEIEDKPQEYLFNPVPVPILYEDEDVIVFNKPAGMPCHQAKYHQQNTLANVFAYHCHQQGLDLQFRCINRLDKDTTGAVVCAKNAHAATRLTGQVDKTYAALLWGILPYEKGVIDAPIGRLGDDYINRVVTPQGQFARTGFQVKAYGAGYTYLDAYLFTGRTHQIRVHFGWLGYPLAGDDLYGWDHLLERQALHCKEVRFLHPITRVKLTVQAPLLPDMQSALEKVGITG